MIKDSFQLIELTARKDTPKTTFNYFVGDVIVPRKTNFKTRSKKIKMDRWGKILNKNYPPYICKIE